MGAKNPTRWPIAVAGCVMQVALGAVYAWSVFRIPLTKAHGWTVSQVTLTFELAILMLGFASFAGGLWMKRVGPRRVAVTAGVCYGLGVMLAGHVGDNLVLLYLSYGVLGGIGLGLGYIVPLATLIKWYPDKRGMIAGIAVTGFGAGALITAPLAERLIAQFGVSQTFTILGLIYLLAVAGAGLLMRNPPEDYCPVGWQPQASQAGQQSGAHHTLKEALHSWQWYGLWSILFLNSVAGISIISQASPMAQELTGASAVAAAGLVGIISIGNGAGRFLWAWFSDFAGRRRVFLMMFVTQAIVFGVLSRVHSFGVLAFLALLVLLCYGGGFGTMPAFAADFFGAQNIGSIYGLMLTAWGAAGVVGPSLIAWVRQTSGNYTDALELIDGIMLVSVVLPFIIRPPKPPTEVSSQASAGDLKVASKAPTR